MPLCLRKKVLAIATEKGSRKVGEIGVNRWAWRGSSALSDVCLTRKQMGFANHPITMDLALLVLS